MPTVSASVGVPRRQAAITPVSVPKTIENTVPSVTIGSVLIRATRRFVETGCSFSNETPRFPWASCFR